MMMNRGENSDNIPTDLILEIFSRLPAKSVARFRCVSKLWGSMLSRPYFNDLFLTTSTARPRLLFVVEEKGKWDFFSSPHHPYGKSSLVLAADFRLKFSEYIKRYDCCSYASGLIHFHKMWIANDEVSVICNPSTGQYAILPDLKTDKDSTSFLGFDPIDKQVKVLIINYVVYNKDSDHHILTLGTDKVSWRKIHCPFGHYPYGESICINGVLYYIAEHSYENSIYVIVCFDVRSEKFKFIDADCYYGKLINYEGKLCGVNFEHAGNTPELHMWVLEDVEKQEWSKYVFTLPQIEVVDSYNLSVLGVTATCEIVLSNFYTYQVPFYVFYFNPERNTLYRVEINAKHQMLGNQKRVFAIADHVEDLNFNIMETIYAAASLSPPEQSTSTSPRNDHQVSKSTSASTREDHQVKTSSTSTGKDQQVRTVVHPQQDRRTFESINRFNALCLLDDDEFTGDKTCESDTSHLQLEDESKRSDTLTHKQTMKSFKLKNKKAITEGVANGSLYKEADKSCKVISGRLSRGSGCLKATAITAVVLAAAGAVAAFVLFFL